MTSKQRSAGGVDPSIQGSGNAGVEVYLGDHIVDCHHVARTTDADKLTDHFTVPVGQFDARPWWATPAPPSSATPAAPRRGRGGTPRTDRRKAAGPPSPKAAAHRPIVRGSRSKASAVVEALHTWASSRACHRSRSRGVGNQITRRHKSLASICHCSRNRSISLTPITNPSRTAAKADPVSPIIYPMLLHISPWLWFSFPHRQKELHSWTQVKFSELPF